MHKKEFFDFCEAHPEMNLWEALLAWSKITYDASFSALLMEKDGKLYNTAKWTGEDNPVILFGDVWHMD